MFEFLKPVLGVSSSDWAVIKAEVLKAAEAVGQRFRDNEAEIAELRAEVERLKREPRQSFAQKLREKGKP